MTAPPMLGFCSGSPSSAVDQMRDVEEAFRALTGKCAHHNLTRRNQRAPEALRGQCYTCGGGRALADWNYC
jgi:hypothetical protein